VTNGEKNKFLFSIFQRQSSIIPRNARGLQAFSAKFGFFEIYGVSVRTRRDGAIFCGRPLWAAPYWYQFICAVLICLKAGAVLFNAGCIEQVFSHKS